ncbi:MAG: hypothetical protein Q4D89_07695 [Arachnia propionica]|uniref:hypothetical protein n=1 Tax=Arachnia propionica TaxID=1750 RepID=UPI0026FE0172|nr:hypothetical protein [Arachnia propionica]
MKMSRTATVVVLALLAGCTQQAPEPTPSNSPTPAPPTSSTPSTPAASPSPSPSLPVKLSLTKDLTHGGAEVVLKRITGLYGNLPALKLDVSETELTITLLDRDEHPVTLRWREGTISQVDSDVKYLEQTTFQPTDFPLGNIATTFAAAEELGAKGEKVLQVVEYRPGEVYMTVTTSPETKTVFFTRKGEAVRTLGFHSVADITQGLKEVVAGARAATQVGFSPEAGYWVDLPPTSGVTERRSRMGALPVYVTRRNETTNRPAFDPVAIDALVLARAIEKYAPDETKPCRVEIDSRFVKVAPTVRYDCDGRVTWTDLAGQEYTEAELN